MFHLHYKAQQNIWMVSKKKDSLKHKLEQRPSPRGVMEKQAKQLGYKTDAAPSLQQTIRSLGKEMVKDALDKALRQRPSAEEAGHGVDTKNAAAIQGAMHELDMAQKRDSISKSMKNR